MVILQISPLAEPIVIGATLAGAGGVIVWFAKLGIDTRDGMRSILQTLHGPKDNPGSGLVMRVEVHHKEVSGALGVLSMENITMDKRMTRVEDRCDMTHPKE